MQRPIFTPKRIITSGLVVLGMLFTLPVLAQNELQYVGELGLSVGGAQYFGDLNPRAAINTVKPAFGVYYRKYLNDYVGVRAHLRYARLGYSDIYNDNEFQRRRNLSFNTDVYELDLQGDFNFFRFEPGSYRYRFTPYFTGGAGLFYYNPFAYLNGKKYYLQPLRTEGQGTAEYPDRKPYSLVSYAFLLGGGFKYNVSRSVNIGVELLYRFAQTDYLDDVSKTYAGANLFPTKPNGENTVAYLLQDRSYATGDPIGVAGRQRGNSRDKDQFVSLEFTISILFTTYKCKF
ncbi:hypothetical protein F0L74_04890 [Chitinophaga agrisoli]|uniref:DUF6089 domain-containing protein n=1 Tax=Chitinophaga agrisoli TaxID=2607653 RepID=A0A5B2VZT5_9BACT|nr:DUF6089 family protein [Chitinophaga agrisoli]KAA2245303.1 hypothetical protein F0L74_04890 [Chitinophaga agrisoli]